MNILHVLSQITPTGSEFYACSLAREHFKNGHRVIIVSDSLTASTEAEYIKAPISKRQFLQRIKNIRFLKGLIKKYRIDIVHAHSRAASWVSYFATKGSKTALISTVHGRQHLHTSTSLYDIYGDKVIAICSSIGHHLVQEVKMKRRKVSVVPNGFDFTILHHNKKLVDSIITISLFGRTNGPKGKITGAIIREVLPAILAKYSNVRFNIAGGDIEALGKSAVETIHELNIKYRDRIKALGFIKDLTEKIHHSSLVICSGRIAVEALYQEIPTLAFGEGCYHGRITNDNISSVIETNFGDILEKDEKIIHDFSKIQSDIEEFITGYPLNANNSYLKEQIISCFDIKKVSGEVMEIYRSVRMKKKHPLPIPALMYHKIPDKKLDSQHKIFVTKDHFKIHLEVLKKRGFTPITFKEYLEFSNEQRSIDEFPEKPVFLTFDDGYKDNYINLLPLMKSYGYKGVIYCLGNTAVTYNFWDADQGDHPDDLMNPEEIKAFVQEGWEIGAHSMTHRDLTECTLEELKLELSRSKYLIEKNFHCSVVSFAYPYGAVNEQVKRETKNEGYSFGISTDTGGIHLEDDRYQIFRVNIFPDDLVNQLIKKTSWWYRYYYFIKRKK